jgi:hypothetical protein
MRMARLPARQAVSVEAISRALSLAPVPAGHLLGLSSHWA